METNINYKFNIINVDKPGSIYNEGCTPAMLSQKYQNETGIGWHRATDATSIFYYENAYTKQYEGNYVAITMPKNSKTNKPSKKKNSKIPVPLRLLRSNSDANVYPSLLLANQKNLSVKQRYIYHREDDSQLINSDESDDDLPQSEKKQQDDDEESNSSSDNDETMTKNNLSKNVDNNKNSNDDNKNMNNNTSISTINNNDHNGKHHHQHRGREHLRLEEPEDQVRSHSTVQLQKNSEVDKYEKRKNEKLQKQQKKRRHDLKKINNNHNHNIANGQLNEYDEKNNNAIKNSKKKIIN